MATPKRIRLERTAGFRMPPGTVNCTRPGPWGNPFVVEASAEGWVVVPRAPRGEAMPADINRTAETVKPYGPWPDRPAAQAMAVEAFRSLMTADRIRLQSIRLRLRGKDLACHCPLGTPCHADFLLEVANADTP